MWSVAGIEWHGGAQPGSAHLLNGPMARGVECSEMKRFLPGIVVVAVVLGTGIGSHLASIQQETGHLDGARVLKALGQYQEDLRREGKEVPGAVSLRDLVARGLLTEDDVSVFAGVDVVLSLSVEESRPQDILARAQLPGGDEVLALADGSVQQVRRGR